MLICTGLSANIVGAPIERVNIFTHVAGVHSQGRHKSTPKKDRLQRIIVQPSFNTGDTIRAGFESSVLWYWL